MWDDDGTVVARSPHAKIGAVAALGRRLAIMRKAWVIIGVALLVLGAPAVVTAQATSDRAADPAEGARLFRARGCIECHAGDVTDLQRQARPLFALAAQMWNHFPHMAERIRASRLATPYFTSSEMRDLVAFLVRNPAPDDLSLVGRAGDARRGERLVADKGCLGCHSITTTHGRRAGGLANLKGLDSPWAVVTQMWNHAFLMELETQSQRAKWPRLTAAEMADLVAFLQALMRAR
jgi:cytochrome c551/c552